MHIVADENIPFVAQAFANLGTIQTVPGRALNAEHVRQADLLLVRSVTRVDAALLRNSRVRFVGTATIGEDHVDTAWLRQQGIAFASAPGCNAESAAEYVISALITLAETQDFDLSSKTIGIIGCGNVGGRVRAKCAALGMTCLIYDPPRQQRGVADDYAAWRDLLAADIVTLHVPLVKTGEHPTLRLANEAFFQALQPGAIFINTARGAVVDEIALAARLARTPLWAVLDVWHNEPLISQALLRATALGTAHIAGYSQDGKAGGLNKIYQAACHFAGQTPVWDMEQVLPPPAISCLRLSTRVTPSEAVAKCVRVCYDLRADDAALRRSAQATDSGAYFDRLRKHYPPRREFRHLRVELDGDVPALRTRLAGLGFSVASAPARI